MGSHRRKAERPAARKRGAKLVPETTGGRPGLPRTGALARPRSQARDHTALISLALGAIVLAAYLPTLDGRFVNWDDARYVTANPQLRGGLAWKTVAWAFTTFYAGNWHPLTWLSLALDYQLYGLEPRGFHATSLAVHVLNTTLVFLIFRRMTGAPWRSAFLAALFGLHPLHVESVAWVAERKDVLSAFFSLLTLGAYVRYVRAPSWRAYAAVSMTFALALLSKPMAITLPLVLLLLDYWPLGRLSRRAVWDKLPLLAMAVAMSLLTVSAQRAQGAVGIDPIPVGARVANALVACVKYLRLTVWPVGLSPWYSHPALEGPPLGASAVAGAAALLAAGTLIALLVRERAPYVAVGWAWYLVTLLPVIGLIQIGRQGMADRYTYVPHLGIFLVVAWTLGGLPSWTWAWGRPAGAGACALVLAALATLTFRQVSVWHDSMTLWTYTARVNPDSFIAHQALGILLEKGGRLPDAIAEYRRAAHIRPGLADVHAQLGQALMRAGKFGAAAARYRKVVALRPNSAEDHNHLAEALLNGGRPVQARRHLERALAIRPAFAEAHNNLGVALLADGRVDEAVAQFRFALQQNPAFAPAKQNLAAALERRAH